jgi:hypothetical protein
MRAFVTDEVVNGRQNENGNENEDELCSALTSPLESTNQILAAPSATVHPVLMAMASEIIMPMPTPASPAP